ncbi:unnamed protein product [Thlaspi arvense]|uniref:Bifunctional inhibitor/plant lipid transfer protein/seed storage helical domain-containing protein n=1 Tax=Thlaspi arvense TaxID=13288 RepID=A0AAU9STY1_THLAR|nr:unnamed protein product [Thlaspi arvense]
MASKTSSSLILFLTFNILFFTLTTACGGGCSSTPKPKPKPKPTPSCPRDTLQLGVCANVLKDLLKIQLGKPPVKPCCSLLKGLVDLEAAACLCTALKANVLGIKLNVPVSLTLLLNKAATRCDESHTLKITLNRCPNHTRAAATVSDQAGASAYVSISVRRSVCESTPSRRVLDYAVPFTVASDLMLQVTAIIRELFLCYLSSKLRPFCLFSVVGVATSLSVLQAFSSPLLVTIGV